MVARPTELTVTATTQGLSFKFNTRANLHYELVRSSNLVNWTPIGDAFQGTGAEMELAVPAAAFSPGGLLRIQVDY